MSDSPADWLVQNVSVIPRGKPVLDVACGAGRHALFLAQRGWTIHAVDRNRNALTALAASARTLGVPITTELVDLEVGPPSLGTQRFGAVVVFNYLHRPLMPALIDAVVRGGVLIYETFTKGQALRGHPKSPRFLLDDGELPRLIEPLELLRSREGEFDGKLVSSIVAIRR